MKLSIIIPTFNEEENLQELLPFFLSHSKSGDFEVIEVDGGSKVNSVGIAYKLGARVVKSAICSRACQMNLGAKEASGEILYFVHADARVLNSFF